MDNKMTTTKNGHLVFVLHNHLPYVINHGTWPHGMDWLNEAAAETYIPLLDMLYRLKKDGIRSGLTVGITPVLCEQLASPVFKSGFVSYLENKAQSANEDKNTFAATGQQHMSRLAGMWANFYQWTLEQFENQYDKNLLKHYKELQDEGYLEIITCAATHGYLALLGRDEAVRAQVHTGVNTYEKHFGRKPRGIWIPECAYRPRYEWKRPVHDNGFGPRMRRGVEEYLHDAGIEYFFVDTHLLKGGKPLGTYLDRFGALKQLWEQFEKAAKQTKGADSSKTPYRPHFASSTGGDKAVNFFTRDPETTIQVWSGEHGYPGNGAYLDFHKKHFPGGHRYWRVTSAKSDLGEKKPYEPDVLNSILYEQSEHFVNLVSDLLQDEIQSGNPAPVVCSPYDGELFGHWWYEGPRWLENVVRNCNKKADVELLSASEYLQQFPSKDVVNIPEGSWGEGGHHHIWLNEFTEWTWKHVYEAEDQMVDISRRLKNRGGLAEEIVTQMARELLLLESSDWQFLISTWAARDYAEARVVKHSDNFQKLRASAEKALAGEEVPETEINFLKLCQQEDPLFKIDLSLWSAPPELEG
jgi:1,4-alpha-glucan branching enzyme